MAKHEIIAVMGATGQQGGATARHLMRDGWRVRALVRDPLGARARELAALGVELCRGDMLDRRSLDAALDGAHGVFSVQPSAGTADATPPAQEVEMGKNVIEAALSARVAHLIYASVDSCEHALDVPHLASKWAIEQHVRASGLAHTILRLPTFMENLVLPELGLGSGTLTFFSAPEQPFPWIAVDDIGAFAAIAFGAQATYANRSWLIAGDVQTGPAIARLLSTALGREIAYSPFSPEVLASAPVLAAIARFVAQYASGFDLAALRRVHPQLLTFDAWLEREGAAKLAALFAS